MAKAMEQASVSEPMLPQVCNGRWIVIQVTVFFQGAGPAPGEPETHNNGPLDVTDLKVNHKSYTYYTSE